MENKIETVKEAEACASPKKRLPRFAIAFYISAAVSSLLFIAFLCSKSFADFFNRYISSILNNE
jgi:hypothetical protein